MKTRILAGLALLLSFSCSFAAQDETDALGGKIDSLRKQGYSVNAITPVFSQLVTFPFPEGFENVFQDISGRHYIQESVLHGETAEKWTQMLTLTGEQELSSNPRITPEIIVATMAQGFNKACPGSYADSGIGAVKFGETQGFAAVLSCGTARPVGQPYSESALIIAVKGKNDYYTVQWAVRAAPSIKPIPINKAEWMERLQKISPIRLCPIVPGEAAPYPSCADKK